MIPLGPPRARSRSISVSSIHVPEAPPSPVPLGRPRTRASPSITRVPAVFDAGRATYETMFQAQVAAVDGRRRSRTPSTAAVLAVSDAIPSDSDDSDYSSSDSPDRTHSQSRR